MFSSICTTKKAGTENGWMDIFILIYTDILNRDPCYY